MAMIRHMIRMNMKSVKALSGGALSLWISASATAASLAITATFSKDSADPQYNEFVNETPSSGYCASYIVDYKALGIFSLSVPINFSAVAAITPSEDEPRKNPMFKVPADWRSLEVRNVDTGEMETVQIRVTGVGSTYVLPFHVEKLTKDGGHHELRKGNSWSWPSAPCQRTSVGFGTSWYFVCFWKIPKGSGKCFKQLLFPIPSLRYADIQFAYQIKTPNPLNMSSGYVGPLSYTIGAGGDFDMGDLMVFDSTELLLNFTLEVEHSLKVYVPPGGYRVELVSQDGWQSWLHKVESRPGYSGIKRSIYPQVSTSKCSWSASIRKMDTPAV